MTARRRPGSDGAQPQNDDARDVQRVAVVAYPSVTEAAEVRSQGAGDAQGGSSSRDMAVTSLTDVQVNIGETEPSVTADHTSMPARNYSWPPFEPGNSVGEQFTEGNLVALKHGAYSPVMIETAAARIHDALIDVAPWLDEDRYLPSVNRYLQATAREQLAHGALVNSSKLSTRLLETATAASRLAWMMAAELGLTPAGHARLKVLVADSEHAQAGIADLLKRGAAIAERRAAEMGDES